MMDSTLTPMERELIVQVKQLMDRQETILDRLDRLEERLRERDETDAVERERLDDLSSVCEELVRLYSDALKRFSDS